MMISCKNVLLSKYCKNNVDFHTEKNIFFFIYFFYYNNDRDCNQYKDIKYPKIATKTI